MSIDEARGLLVVEYEQLKAEQRARIGLRDNLIYVTLAAYAAIVVAVMTTSGQIELLLVLPVAATVLGWTHLINDDKISTLGRYVRSHLAPRLEQLHPEMAPVFGWEAEHRSDRRRTSRKYLQLTADLMTFNIPAIVAVALYWALSPIEVPLVVVSVVEVACSGVLAWQRLLHADIR